MQVLFALLALAITALAAALPADDGVNIDAVAPIVTDVEVIDAAVRGPVTSFEEVLEGLLLFDETINKTVEVVKGTAKHEVKADALREAVTMMEESATLFETFADETEAQMPGIMSDTVAAADLEAAARKMLHDMAGTLRGARDILPPPIFIHASSRELEGLLSLLKPMLEQSPEFREELRDELTRFEQDVGVKLF